MNIKPHKPELVSLLKEKLLELNNLCNLFDSGNGEVIMDIAGIINQLFQNTEISKSLLNQLKLTHVPVYCSAEFYNPKSLINFLALLKLERRDELGLNYFPKFNQAELTGVSQENWWKNKKVIIDSLGSAYTRAKIIKSIANAGGELDSLDTSGWNIKGNSVTIINPIPATVRQIVFELIESFKKVDVAKESKLHYKSSL